MFPGVCTESVGLPLVLLCREMKTIRLGLVKLSVRVCALIAAKHDQSNVFPVHLRGVNRVFLKTDARYLERVVVQNLACYV